MEKPGDGITCANGPGSLESDRQTRKDSSVAEYLTFNQGAGSSILPSSTRGCEQLDFLRDPINTV